MQRVGAIVMSINSVLCSVIVLMTIAGAYSDTWTTLGVTSSAFGVGVILLLLPIGMTHGLAAVVPQILDPWRPDPNSQTEELRTLSADRIKDMYLVVGWFAAICAVVLLIYSLVV